MSVPAGIYLRISRDSEGLGLGVKRQLADCEKLVQRLGWEVAQVYEDNDVSATRIKPRPAYTRMMRDVECGLIKAVAVWDVDRLTRTPRELEDVIDHADRLGLKLASVGGDIDLATEQGRMMARMKGTVARYEVEQQRRRLKAKHNELAASGAHIGQAPIRVGLPARPHSGHQPRGGRRHPRVRRPRPCWAGAVEDLQRSEPPRHHHQHRTSLADGRPAADAAALAQLRRADPPRQGGRPRAVGADHRPSHPRTRRRPPDRPGAPDQQPRHGAQVPAHLDRPLRRLRRRLGRHQRVHLRPQERTHPASTPTPTRAPMPDA